MRQIGLLVGGVRLLHPLAGALLWLVLATSAWAQTYPTPPFDFGGDPFPRRPARLSAATGNPAGPVPTLVVVMRRAGVDHSSFPASSVAASVFGPRVACTHSVATWFRTASGGRFDLSRAAETQGTVNDGVVLIEGVMESDWETLGFRRLAVEAADPFVDYGSFDADGDGTLQNEELLLYAVNAANSAQGGQAGGLSDVSALDGVGFAGFSVPIVDGMPGSFGTWIHEAMHALFGHDHFYGYGVGSWSAMGPTIGSGPAIYGVTAWTKMLLGWTVPTVVSQDGRYPLRRSDLGGSPLLLYDPVRGTSDYLMLENRVNALCGTIDFNSPDSGLLLTRIETDGWPPTRDSEPPIEVLAADGTRWAPGCGDFAVLTADASIGSSTLAIDQWRFPTPGFPLLIRQVDGEDAPNASTQEEIVLASAASSGTNVVLTAPTTRFHPTGSRARWRAAGWGGYFATELAADAASGASSLTVAAISGTLPATPFVATIRTTPENLDVTVDAVAGSVWTLDEPLPDPASSGDRVSGAPSNFCRGADGRSAWDSADGNTPATMAAPLWQDGSSTRIRVFDIGPAAETTEVYVDVPAAGPGVFLDVAHVLDIDPGTIPATVWNTGATADQVDVAFVDQASRSYGSELGVSLAAGGPWPLSSAWTFPPSGSIPEGLALDWTATSRNDPSVRDSGVALVDWDFFSDFGGTSIGPWLVLGTPPAAVFGDWSVGDPGAGTLRLRADSLLSYTISPIDDNDVLRVAVPSLGTYLDPLIPVAHGPVPSCGSLGYQVSGPIVEEEIHAETVLHVRVEAENGFTPPDDFVRATGISTPRRAGSLFERLECPDLSDTELFDLTDGGRQRLQRYAYTYSAEFLTQVLRVPDGSLAQILSQSREARAASCSGGFFPRCIPSFLEFAEATFDLQQPKVTGCLADGCDYFFVSWDETSAVDMAFTAPVGSAITLLDAFGAEVAKALPEGLTLTHDADGGETPAGLAGSVPSSRPGGAHATNPVRELASQPPSPGEPWPGPTPAIPDPVAPLREKFKLYLPDLAQGLYLLQVVAPPEFDPEAEPDTFSMSWVPPADNDGDGIDDSVDNCQLIKNVGQKDTDADGYGNPCDCDFDNDGSCNIADFSIFLTAFQNQVDSGAGSDMNADGTVNIEDFGLFLSGFQASVPGPSGLVP
ncbi:MAG: hypothetical protein JRG83_01245 [Deltaproteobacteria bacterium]|nr:hypothetical protein [Deltaproteobacteria bacterium]